jgi:WD40 repeat protein
MKTDISRLPFKESNHSLGVFLQMGRVQLDADWNEQAELSLRMLQRLASDAIETGSANDGFRVDDRILLKSMDSVESWTAEKANAADPAPRLFIDYFDFAIGRGSLATSGAAALAYRLPSSIDCSQWNEIVFAAKGSFLANEIAFYLGSGGTRGTLTTAEDASPVNGWRIFRASPTTAAPAIDLTQVDQYGFVGLKPARKYQIDSIRIDRPIRQRLVHLRSLAGVTAAANAGDIPQLSINDDDRLLRNLALEVTKATSVSYDFPVPTDLSHVRKLIVSAKVVGGGPPAITMRFIDAAAAQVDLGGAVLTTSGSWQVSTYSLPQAGIDWKNIKTIAWTGLAPASTYRLGPVYAEMSLQGNLVIMGGDGTPEGAGRFYGDGLAAIKEADETYFSQRDLPAADPTPLAPPADNKTRADLVYLDLWERPLTYIEDPAIREIALEGPDTCTRTQLVAQVRILMGGEVDVPNTPQPPMAAFNALPQFGGGVLSTKDTPGASLNPCADPCEPVVAGTFVGTENRLYRVEIHKFGQIGDANAATTASFKWSKENGAVATALLTDADAGNFSVTVEKPELFRDGDLIEISNDLIDLVTTPYEDRTAHRAHERGELRKITSVDLTTRTISWQDAASAEPQFHGPLARAHKIFYHASIRRWDNLAPVTEGNISLDDGVTIEFGGAGFLPGDYWVFATRTADNSVEPLIEAPPRGILHRYYTLAQVQHTVSAGADTVVVSDLRSHFHPLTDLQAAEVDYDSSQFAGNDPAWASVENVQQALDALAAKNIGFDIRDHNKFLHGLGIVCGLQVNCNADRTQVTVRPGYALDCEGNPIRVETAVTFPVVARADAIGALDTTGNGEVCLTIGSGANSKAAIQVEAASNLSFWDSVLEGTLLRDFYNNSIKPVVDLLRASFQPFPATTVPVPDSQKNLISFLNLLFQLPFLMPATARYVFLSTTEDALLRKFYTDLKNLLASKTFCAMFDDVTPFPDYPYPQPPGIETSFGLLQFHRRMRVHPKNQVVYTCGTGSKIHVFDMSTGQQILELDFPGGSNVEVQDVAFSPAGDRLFAVGLLNNQDSVFATATINATTNAHTWGSSTVVCDILFVTLGTTSLHPTNLYAIGKSLGLYSFDPAAIPLTPTPVVAFNATGIMTISENPDIAVVGEASGTPPGTVSATFDRYSRIDLSTMAAPAVFYAATGTDSENDVVITPANVIATAQGAAKTVNLFDVASGAAAAQVLLPSNSVVRLAVDASGKWVLATLADQHRVLRLDLSAGSLAIDTGFRIPVQLFPFDIAVNSVRGEIYVLNLLSCTISVAAASVVLSATPPAYTAEPPVTLNDYRDAILQAYADILSKSLQFLKDAFCEQFLMYCPDCRKDNKVYLGCVEIQNKKVYNICNFSQRRYVKSVKLVEYWLSAFSVLPVLRRAFTQLCCRVL